MQAADSHEMIRVVGARENNLKNVSVEIPKRRLTVFTGVSGSGKSSLVFATIANESQRLINETYPRSCSSSCQLNRPEVDALENGQTPRSSSTRSGWARTPLDRRYRDRRAGDAPHPLQPTRSAAHRLAAGVLVQHPLGSARGAVTFEKGKGKTSRGRTS